MLNEQYKGFGQVLLGRAAGASETYVAVLERRKNLSFARDLVTELELLAASLGTSGFSTRAIQEFERQFKRYLEFAIDQAQSLCELLEGDKNGAQLARALAILGRDWNSGGTPLWQATLHAQPSLPPVPAIEQVVRAILGEPVTTP